METSSQKWRPSVHVKLSCCRSRTMEKTRSITNFLTIFFKNRGAALLFNRKYGIASFFSSCSFVGPWPFPTFYSFVTQKKKRRQIVVQGRYQRWTNYPKQQNGVEAIQANRDSRTRRLETSRSRPDLTTEDWKTNGFQRSTIFSSQSIVRLN